MIASSLAVSPTLNSVTVPALHIRAAEMRDIDTILILHCEAFADKFGAAFGAKGISRGATAMANAWTRQGASSLAGMLVAEFDDQLIGTVMLRTYEMDNDQTYATELAFQQTLGIWGAAWSIFALSLLSHKIGKNEGFITDVAVLKPFRRRGVARTLLAEAEKKARAHNKSYLGLYVSSANDAARHLYEINGFRQAHVRRSWMTHLIFGQREWIYMRKNVQE